jgi:hypothetical protein
LLKEHMFDIILSKDNIFESEELDKDSTVSIKETAENNYFCGIQSEQ